MLGSYGRHCSAYAPIKLNHKLQSLTLRNNLTRRNAQLTEQLPSKSVTTSLQSANVKALRLFRHICRMLPFIIKIHQITHRVNPIQAKRYVANWFRTNSKQTDLVQIDRLIQYGYETVYEAEMNYSNTGYLYKFIIPPAHHKRDHGINRFQERRGQKLNRSPPTKFLKSFYQGQKSHDI